MLSKIQEALGKLGILVHGSILDIIEFEISIPCNNLNNLNLNSIIKAIYFIEVINIVSYLYQSVVPAVAFRY